MNLQVAAYARVSSEKQAEAKTILSQVDRLKEYAVEKGYALDPDMIFMDNGISGSTLERPALDALRDRAVRGEITKVIILSPDRLARKSAHQLILIEELGRLGVDIIFTNHEVSDSPEDQMLLQIQGVIAEYEREKIRERMRRGRIYKAKQGKVNVLVAAPYGFVYIKCCEGVDARYEVHPEEAAIVQKIFYMYTNDKMSLGKIAQRLLEMKVPSPNGLVHWSPATLHGMLKNPAYVGRAAAFRKRSVERTIINKSLRGKKIFSRKPKSSQRLRPESEWITIPVPAIIDDRTWCIAKSQSEENTKLAPRNNTRNYYLLSSIAHCEQCGYHIYGMTPSNPRYSLRRVYRCAGRDKNRRPQGRVCSQKPIRAEELEHAVWEQTKKLLLNPELVLQEYAERTEKGKLKKESWQKIVLKKNAELRNLEHERQRLLDLYQHGAVILSEIEPRLAKIRERVCITESEIKLLQQEEEGQKNRLKLIESFQGFTNTIEQNLDDLTKEEKKRIVRLVVKKVAVNLKQKKITIQHMLPLSQINRLHSSSLPIPQPAHVRDPIRKTQTRGKP